MSREVRMVPGDWQHPRGEGRYIPLYEGADRAQRERDYHEEVKEYGQAVADSDYSGPPETWDCFMPDFPEDTATHLMMYETTSEGTPISPAFETPEELAHWLAYNNASAFGGMGASYDAWLRVCRGERAPSGVMVGGQIMSGVEALGSEAPE
ncbi:MAG: hypothetical protein U1E29_18335 [Coriobacteriia bacterium]|nr:hypothetical protein [Coriobacteriia bacterium]